MKSLERRIERLEDAGGDDEELFDIEGIMMTGAEIRQMLREVAEKGSRI